jgi:hypothetical protein
MMRKKMGTSNMKRKEHAGFGKHGLIKKTGLVNNKEA